MRYLALFFCAVFVLFAYWQWNDPDPVWWIGVYLVVVYALFQVFRGRGNGELLGVLTVLYMVGAVNSWLQMQGWEGFFTEGEGIAMKTMNQELARESAGMAICAAVMSMYWVWMWAQRKRSEQ